MKRSDTFGKNAENCLFPAEKAKDGPTHVRFIRMSEAWRSLAEAQDWLDGVILVASSGSRQSGEPEKV